MTEEERRQYLANIYALARVDENVDSMESDVYEKIAREIGAGYLDTRDAMEMASKDDFKIKFPHRLSERISNLEDMLVVAYSDKKLHELEKKTLQDYARQIGISQDQFSMIQKEARERLDKFRSR